MNDCPCGCRFTPEETILCPEATQLWNKVQHTYEAANRGTGTWDEYAEAQQAYYDHYKALGNAAAEKEVE